MNYFYIKQKSGRKSVFRVYQTNLRKCDFIQGFATEDAAKAKVKELMQKEIIL